jgi:hypothetical protein
MTDPNYKNMLKKYLESLEIETKVKDIIKESPIYD